MDKAAKLKSTCGIVILRPKWFNLGSKKACTVGSAVDIVHAVNVRKLKCGLWNTTFPPITSIISVFFSIIPI